MNSLGRIKDKREAIDLFQSGAFGNSIQTWYNREEFGNWQGPVVLRYRAPAGGGPCLYDVPLNELDATINRLVKEGWQQQLMYFHPRLEIDHLLVVQGELMLSTEHYTFFYSRVKKPMRKALAEGGKHTYGLRALLMLREAMTDSSFSDLEELLGMYPDSVFEISVWSHCLGTIPGRNAIVWEVRNY